VDYNTLSFFIQYEVSYYILWWILSSSSWDVNTVTKVADIFKSPKSDFFQMNCTSLIQIWNVRVNKLFFYLFGLQ
jgi:hypothetical protein